MTAAAVKPLVLVWELAEPKASFRREVAATPIGFFVLKWNPIHTSPEYDVFLGSKFLFGSGDMALAKAMAQEHYEHLMDRCPCAAGTLPADKILAHLDRWRDAVMAVDERIQALDMLAGISFESPLITALHQLQDATAAQLADLLGIEPIGGFEVLQDWHMTHEFGSSPMVVNFTNGDHLEVSSNEELAELIHKMLQQEAQK